MSLRFIECIPIICVAISATCFILTWGDMPWLAQKPKTTHCSPIAIYNACKAVGIWWIPFRLIKLMCLTNLRYIDGAWSKGTFPRDIERTMHWIFGSVNIIHNPEYEVVEEILRQGHPIVLSYSPRLEGRHSAAIIPGRDRLCAVIVNHRYHDREWFQFENEHFKKEWEIIKWTTLFQKNTLTIYYPTNKWREKTA